MIPSLLHKLPQLPLGSLLLLALLAWPACDRSPEMPPEGAYQILNPEDLPVADVSVEVEGDRMTVSFTEDDGARRTLVYRIELRD